IRTLDATFALKAEDVSITDDPSIPLDARADRPPSALISDAIGTRTHASQIFHYVLFTQRPSGSHALLCQSTKACGTIGVTLPASAAHLASVPSFFDKPLGKSDPASAVCRKAMLGKASYDLPGSSTRPSTHL
ncbi:hypothetical protein GGG16DRAFT_28717, partial [Schizophyllum commune]